MREPSAARGASTAQGEGGEGPVTSFSRGAARRRQQAQRARRERQILLGVVAVLAVVAVIVTVGLFVTVYRPPRAHVAVIRDQDVTAADVVDRAAYYMVSEGGAFSRQVEGVAEFALERLEREAILRDRAPAQVGEVTPEDVEAKSKELLGNLETEEAYANALQRWLQASGVSREQYEDILRATVLSDRLKEQFKGEVPATLEQRHVLVIRTPTLTNAERVVERANAGEDFEGLAQQYAADRSLQVDRGWMPLDLMTEEQRLAVEGLGPGQVSAPVASGLFFDVYRIAEVDPAREVTEDQRDALASRRVDAWVDEQKPHVRLERDLSAGETRWIEDQVTGRVREGLQQVQFQ